MSESELYEKTEEHFNAWKETQDLESMSIRDVYECAFRHGIEASGVDIKDD